MANANVLISQGSEITDVVRSTGLDGDGFSWPDYSYGLYDPMTNLLQNSDFETDLTNWTANNYLTSNTNLLSNPGFETNTSGWVASGAGATISRDTTFKDSGAASGKIVVTAGSNAGIRTTGVNATSGRKYQNQIRVWATNGRQMILQLVRADFATVVVSQAFVGTGAWQTVQLIESTNYPATELMYFFIKITDGAGDTFWVDNAIEVDGADGTYLVDSNGTITRMAGSGLPVGGGRFCRYNITQNGGWGAVFGNTFSNYWAGWPGGAAFDVTKTYSLSFWMRFWIDFNNPTHLPTVGILNSNGTTTVMNQVNVTGLTTSWQRFVFPFTPLIAGGAPMVYMVRNNSATDFGSIDFTAMQLEKKAYKSAYKSSPRASFGTRSSEAYEQMPVAHVDTTQMWAAFCFKPGYPSTLGSPHGANYPCLWEWGDDINNRISLFLSAGTQPRLQRAKAGTTDNLSATALSFSENQTTLVMMRLTAAQLGIASNGGAFQTAVATGGNVPTLAATTANIGRYQANSSLWNLFGRFKWAMFGLGTVTDVDSATLNALGITVPDFNTLPLVSRGTLIWPANTVGYFSTIFGGLPDKAIEPAYSLKAIEPSYKLKAIEPAYAMRAVEPAYKVKSLEPAYTVKSIEPAYKLTGVDIER